MPARRMTQEEWEAIDRVIIVGELDDWFVTLATGDVVIVWAHGYSEVDGFYVFSALMDSHKLGELARFPVASVSKIRSSPRDLDPDWDRLHGQAERQSG
jgi:hypothetical protein